jgi:hypothetical protein
MKEKKNIMFIISSFLYFVAIFVVKTNLFLVPARPGWEIKDGSQV